MGLCGQFFHPHLLCEFDRRDVPGSRVGALPVVVLPCGAADAGLATRREERLIQELVPGAPSPQRRSRPAESAILRVSREPAQSPARNRDRAAIRRSAHSPRNAAPPAQPKRPAPPPAGRSTASQHPDTVPMTRRQSTRASTIQGEPGSAANSHSPLPCFPIQGPQREVRIDGQRFNGRATDYDAGCIVAAA